MNKGVWKLAAIGFLFVAGCSKGPRITSIRNLEPFTTYDNVGDTFLLSNNTFDIMGVAFGTQWGAVTLGGTAVEVVAWNDGRIRVKLGAEHTSGALVVTRADGAWTAGPKILINQGASSLYALFKSYIVQYAKDHEKSEKWLKYYTTGIDFGTGVKKSFLEHYMGGYQKQVATQKKLTIVYRYHNGIPYPKKKDFPLPEWVVDSAVLTAEQAAAIQEFQHMQLLEAWLEASFPGYDIEMAFEGDPATADVIVTANYSSVDGGSWWVPWYSYEEDIFVPEILADNEEVIAHELGHSLGLDHHYNADQTEYGLWMLPGDTECTMNQNGTTWCSGCAAALGLNEQDGQTAELLLKKLRSYIDDL